jgi:hypothetical protein
MNWSQEVGVTTTQLRVLQTENTWVLSSRDTQGTEGTQDGAKQGTAGTGSGSRQSSELLGKHEQTK